MEPDYYKKPYAFYGFEKRPPENELALRPELMVHLIQAIPSNRPQTAEHADLMFANSAKSPWKVNDWFHDPQLGIVENWIYYHHTPVVYPPEDSAPSLEAIQSYLPVENLIHVQWAKPSQRALETMRRDNDCMAIRDQRTFYFLLHNNLNDTTPLVATHARLVSQDDIVQRYGAEVSEGMRDVKLGTINLCIFNISGKRNFQGFCATVAHEKQNSPREFWRPLGTEVGPEKCIHAFTKTPTQDEIDVVLKRHDLKYQPVLLANKVN